LTPASADVNVNRRGENTMATNRLFAFAIAAALASPAAAQQVQLKAGTFLPTVDTFWYPPIQKFLDTVNENGKQVGLSINMVAAGGKGMSPFEMGNALQSGVLDLIHLAGTFYNKIVPLADAQKLSTISTAEERQNGTYAALEPIYNQRMNAHYLGRWGEGVPFHFYMNKRVESADLKGIKIRGTSVYQAFIERLGGTLVLTPPAEAYTAVERGVVDGLGWPLWGIEAWGWQKILKYRIEPGFYSADVSVLVNLDTWKKLAKPQQDVLTAAMIELENEFPKLRAKNDEAARKIQADAGIQVITLPPSEAAKWLKAAEDAGWDDLMKKDPVNAPKLRALTTGKK
jgi:TRAP-type C4-dicarboxylate transport system substrate-binding protein